ncbi:cysteine ABC transporter substrate-binding protein, partial [Klebsiella pneumoniae]|nr:cysteine ABC transporter substrate-binding protein [Klebsiella pneumoniae]
MWERDVHKTKQGFRGKTMRNKTTKIALALGMLLLASQAQA